MQVLLAGFASAAIATMPASAQAGSGGGAHIALSGPELTFSGGITDDAVEQARQLLTSDTGRQTRTLVIESTSGQAEAAMRLGSLVRERRLTVRVQNVCGGLCAYYVAPAAAHVIIPPDTFFILSAMPSPQFNEMIAARSEDMTRPESERQQQAELSAAMNDLLVRQDGYYRSLGVDPSRAYVIVGVLASINRQVQTAGKGAGNILLMPDAALLHQCFGIAQVDMPVFTAADSRRLAHAGRTPLAFLIGGVPHYEGERLAPLPISCVPRR